MKKNIYANPSFLTWMVQKFKNFFEPNSLVRISNNNKLHDYRELIKRNDSELWQLHRDITNVIDRMQKEYDSYDYGSGYFYQSLDKIAVTGYRNTSKRVDKLNLKQIVTGKKVLDIGTNSGFILFAMDNTFESATGVEYNPFLIEIGNLVQKYTGQRNVELVNAKFENFTVDANKTFDVVLSLANHSTYDGNTSQGVNEYFSNISRLLNPDGILIFESHPPEIEPDDKLNMTLQIINQIFDVTETKKLAMTNFLDKNRTYVIAKKK